MNDSERSFMRIFEVGFYILAPFLLFLSTVSKWMGWIGIISIAVGLLFHWILVKDKKKKEQV